MKRKPPPGSQRFYPKSDFGASKMDDFMVSYVHMHICLYKYIDTDIDIDIDIYTHIYVCTYRYTVSDTSKFS